MYPPKERAAKLLAVGESIEDVAKTVKKDEQTVKLWLLEPEFCQILRDNVQGTALRIIVGYLTDDHEDKHKAMVALALIRMDKSRSVSSSGGVVLDPLRRGDQPPGFSEEQLKRLKGEE